MDGKRDKYFLTGVDDLIGFKLQAALAEVEHLARIYVAVNGNIMGNERFIIKALVSSALGVKLQNRPSSFIALIFKI